MIFVRNASATAYGEKEREKWREYVLSFDEQEMSSCRSREAGRVGEWERETGRVGE